MAQAQIEQMKISLTVPVYIKNCEIPIWYNFQESKFKICYKNSGIEISSSSFKEIINHLIQTNQLSMLDYTSEH
jgi:hypothetical protein